MTIKQVTSPSNSDIKAIRALDMRKERRETGLFYAEGLRHVLEGVDCGWQLMTVAYHWKISGRPEIEKVRQACIGNGGHCLEVNDEVLEKLSHKDNPQLVIGVFKQKTVPLADMPKKKCLVALEQVRDPGNLGTIIRAIDSVGADGVILIDQCCDPFSPEATRASMGSVFAIPIAQTIKLDFLQYIKSWKGTAIGTHLDDRSMDFRKVKYEQPLLLVMGNEQAGLSDDIAKALPNLVKLPMNGRADSLNLGVATGIMLYAALEPWR